jgi:hypothetical protein
VIEFVEKPSLARAVECLRLGGLRNTLILAGRARAFLGLYGCDLPEPDGSSARNENDVGLDGGETVRVRVNALAALYPHLSNMDLSRDILQSWPRRLRLLPLPECGWTDIGTLERLEAWWRRHPKVWNRVRHSGVFPLQGRWHRAVASTQEAVEQDQEDRRTKV